MDQILDAFVTIHAIEFRVDGLVERVRWKNESDSFSVNGACSRRVKMAVEAIRVFEGFGAGRNKAEAQEKEKHHTANEGSLTCDVW